MANYIAPEKSLNSYTCPHCHTLSLMKDYTYTDQITLVGPREYREKLYVHKCENCGRLIIWIDDKYIYPELTPAEPNEDMPADVLSLYNEAGTIYTRSPRAACALLRLAIERLCNDLGETDSIDKNIGTLTKRGLSSHVQQALDIVRVVGNKAVHPGEIQFDIDNCDTANMLFNLINIIVERLVSEPRRIKSLFDKLPQSTKQAIEKKDKAQ